MPSVTKRELSAPAGRATGVLAPVPVIKDPLPVMHVFGIANAAASNAVLTASDVAAVEELVLVTESDNTTTPQVPVVAALTERVGFTPPVLTRGKFTVKEPSAVPLEALVIRPSASTVIVGLL